MPSSHPTLTQDYDVVIVGSGPCGSAYARTLFELSPDLRVLMVEAGPVLSDPPGGHVKNILDPELRAAAQRSAQGPNPDEAPGRPGTFLLGKGAGSMPSVAMSSNVGGMGAHWTCACPRPSGRERIPFIDEATMDDALTEAERLLAVTSTAFDGAPFSSQVRARLATAFPPAGAVVQAMPLAVTKNEDGSVTWSGSDVVLGPLVKGHKNFELRPETLCLSLLTGAGKIAGVELEDRVTSERYTVTAANVVVAADALRTPQLLFASGIRPAALGRYLNDQPQVITAVRLPADVVQAAAVGATSNDSESGAAAQHSGVSWVPFTDDSPFHGQVMQLDASPIPLAEDDAVAPGSIIGLGWFSSVETRPENRLEFSESELDAYSMPAITVHYELSPNDLKTIEDAKAAVMRAGEALGTFLDDRPPFLLPAGTSLHYQGTTRMGPVDDGTSVCGPDSQVWAVEGLYVAGNSVIPTSTACNPTLTSVALSVLGARAIAHSSAEPLDHAPTEKSHIDETARNREIIQDFAQIFYNKGAVREAFEKYVAQDYIQHNPGIADGRDAAIEALEPKFKDPGFKLEVLRVAVDGSLAAIHIRAHNSIGSDGAVMDFYRIKEGTIVEHWDVLQQVPESSKNAHPMF